ncbi:MAG: hypothetical protein ACJA1C_000792 [Crocinitomicaceae bacterium]|jgi:hypothetical protein
MNKSTLALILTTFSALIVYVSVYIPNLTVKYIISAVGAILAIIGAFYLFSLRKPFVKVFHRKDWYIHNFENDNAEYHLRIPFKEFRKNNPNVLVESSDGTFWKNLEITIVKDDNTKDVILAKEYHEGLKSLNFDYLDTVRVTIK